MITAACLQDDLEKLRTSYDAFLERWPLCYGYWKKYADAEHRHGSSERSINVFERGVTATPCSVDVWVHYAAYLKTDSPTAPEPVRRCVSPLAYALHPALHCICSPTQPSSVRPQCVRPRMCRRGHRLSIPQHVGPIHCL